MKSILTLIQLANLVISQDVPQGEVKSNNIFYRSKKIFGRVLFEIQPKGKFFVGVTYRFSTEFQTKLILYYPRISTGPRLL